MKADDPRLVESHKSLTERIKNLDDMIVTVLKYHVSVEQSMVELIEAHGKKVRTPSPIKSSNVKASIRLRLMRRHGNF
jgi:hypothetical protein